jgi:hypothetical protein
MGQGLSNESKFVKIGRLEPRFSCSQRKNLKVKNIIPRLKSVKDTKGLIIKKEILKRTTRTLELKNSYNFVNTFAIRFLFRLEHKISEFLRGLN